MKKREMQIKIKEQLLKDEVYVAPDEIGQPPINSKLGLFKAVSEERVADIELTVKLINAMKQRIRNSLEWVDLENDKKKLGKLFTDSNKAIKKKQAHVARFREKIKENDIGKLTAIFNIMKVQWEIEKYKNITTELEKYVNQYSIYEKFLASVVENSAEFISIQDILNRYETLEHMRSQCTKILKEELEAESQVRKEMLTLIETKANDLKNLGNKLIMLHVRSRQATERRVYWEHTVEQIKSMMMTTEEHNMELWSGCWDLYRQMCKRKGEQPTALPQDMKAQLEYIKKTVMFYKDVNTIATTIKHALTTLGDDNNKKT